VFFWVEQETKKTVTAREMKTNGEKYVWFLIKFKGIYFYKLNFYKNILIF